MNLPINHPVAQTFLSAGLGDFPVAGSEDGNTGLESPVNPQVGKPALQLCGSLRFRSPVREILGGILLLLCAGPVARAHAHDPGLSSVAVTIQPERCDATLLFSKVDAAILLRRRDAAPCTLRCANAVRCKQEQERGQPHRTSRSGHRELTSYLHLLHL